MAVDQKGQWQKDTAFRRSGCGSGLIESLSLLTRHEHSGNPATKDVRQRRWPEVNDHIRFIARAPLDLDPSRLKGGVQCFIKDSTVCRRSSAETNFQLFGQWTRGGGLLRI